MVPLHSKIVARIVSRSRTKPRITCKSKAKDKELVSKSKAKAKVNLLREAKAVASRSPSLHQGRVPGDVVIKCFWWKSGMCISVKPEVESP